MITTAGFIRHRKIRFLIFTGLLVLFCFFQLEARAQDNKTGRGQTAGSGTQKSEKQIKLWNRAMAFLGDGNKLEAAPLFRLFYERYPDSEKAEKALWHAARLYKHLALVDKEDDWDKIRNLFREFTVAFPESDFLARAYLEVGRAYMKMGYFREAVPYFGIIIRRFPEQDIVEEASILKSRALYKIDRVGEAVRIYRELGKTVDKNYTRLAEGYKYFRENRYHDALGSFLKILKRDPSFYLKEPDILRIMGESYLQTGQTAQGRKRLEHYLNLNPGSHREDVLFRIGESYRKEEKEGLASRFYEKAMAESDKGERIYSFSRYRLSRFEEKEMELKPGDGGINEEEFIEIREAVLDQGNSGEVIQEARLELIEYYRDSQKIDKVYDLGRIYLNYDSDEAGREKIESMVCRILDNRLGDLLDNDKYKEVYQLYKDEYAYIKRCPRASVRVKVGRALESLSLYDKASRVYWRAMDLEMSPEEKKELYLRRAETYLAGNNYESADTLLTHLRRVYEGQSIIGGVYFLSAKLSEAQGREEAALEFYEKSASEPPYYKGKEADFAESYLDLLLKQEEPETFAKELERFSKDNGLGTERLQYWYVRLGDYYRKHSEPAKAGSAYDSALADNMPAKNELTQKAYLYYGDVQLSLGNVDRAIDLHNKALDGPNQLYTKMARQRLEEDEMSRNLPEVE